MRLRSFHRRLVVIAAVFALAVAILATPWALALALGLAIIVGAVVITAFAVDWVRAGDEDLEAARSRLDRHHARQ